MIREQKTDRRHYDTAWTLSAVRGVVTALLLVLFAPFIANWFNDPRLEAVIYALAAASVVDGLDNIAVVDFQKSLTFDKDFRFMVWPKLVAFSVTLSLAFLWRDYWALVIGILSSTAARFVLSYAMHPFRPRPSLEMLSEIFGFSKWLLANNILQFVARRSDIVIIGKMLDAGSLGLYTVAREVSSMASTELLLPIQRAVFPGLAKLAEDPKTIRRAFLDSLAVIVTLGLPLTVGIGLIADPLVRLVLGAKWIDAIPLLQILVIVGIMRIFNGNSQAFLLATNRPHLTTVLAVCGAFLGVTLVPWAIWNWGMIGAAWASGAAGALLVLVNYAIVCRKCAIPPSNIALALWRPIVACLVMTGAVGGLLAQWARTETVVGLIMELSCAILTGALAYVAAVLVLWGISGTPAGAEQRLLGLIKRYFMNIKFDRVSDAA